jgi:DNA-directed RNA polymerase alpha subunit
VAGLLRKSEKSLLELEGMGEKGIKEIKKALKKLGLELKSS